MAAWRHAALALVVGIGPVGIGLGGCSGKSGAGKDGKAGKAGAKASADGKGDAAKGDGGKGDDGKGDAAKGDDGEGDAAKGDGGKDDGAAADGGALQGAGKVLPNAPLPLLEIIGGDPKTAESHLGEPIAKGMQKESCVRFVPDRTWFECKWVWQRYADKTETYGAIEVTYEDGKAVSLTLEKIPGKGGFDPKIALALAGLELPGKPQITEPGDEAKVWSYFNSEAQLVIHGRQYRVRVSAVGDRWETSKVEIILNDPLNDDEKKRVFEVKPQAGSAEGGDAPAPKPE